MASVAFASTKNPAGTAGRADLGTDISVAVDNQTQISRRLVSSTGSVNVESFGTIEIVRTPFVLLIYFIRLLRAIVFLIIYRNKFDVQIYR